VTGTLPVANGGTGVTTSTGSGANVLSTSPTLVTPNIGAATGTSVNLSGNATVGGTLTVNGGTLTLSGAAYPRLTSNGTSGGAFQIQKNGTNYGLFYGNDTDTIIDSNTSSNVVFQTGGVTRATINSSAFTISLTTASTSTSTGALVVGGGVGVAGAIFAGGNLTVSGTGTSAFSGPVTISKAQAAAYTSLTIQNGNASGYSQLNMISGPNTASINYAPGVFFKISIPSADSFQVSTNNTTALTIDSSQNATFAGSIKTVAPSGGTAKPWELGEAATVSPTSPNRTIRVEIDGTVYYIHAKTTND
jgi:hypothetical protein